MRAHWCRPAEAVGDPFKARRYPGWPSLHLQGNPELSYRGPLPPSCRCLPAHPPLRGFNERPPLPQRLASSFGGIRWPPFCSLLDTWSLGMRPYLPRAPHLFLRVHTCFLLRLLLVPRLNSTLLGVQVSSRSQFSVPPLDLLGCRLCVPFPRPLSSSLSLFRFLLAHLVLYAHPGRFAIEERCFAWLWCYAWRELWFGARQAPQLGRCEFCVCQVVCLFKYPWRVH